MHDRFAAALVLLAGVSVALWAPAMQAGGAAAAGDATLRPEALYDKSFRFSWKAGAGSGQNGTATLRKDGTIAGYQSYTELAHSFKAPGIHVVTAQTTADGMPVAQKLKIVVGK